MINGINYSFITCTEKVNLPGKAVELHSKLIHNDDVMFRLQQLQMEYPNKNFTVTRCRP